MQTCFKNPYPTPLDAKRVARQIRQAAIAKGRPKFPRGVHPCSVCHAWHITSYMVKSKWRL